MDMSSPQAAKNETVTYRHENGEEIYTADAVTFQRRSKERNYRGKYDGPYGTIKMTIDRWKGCQ
jgi:hypothetical protein